MAGTIIYWFIGYLLCARLCYALFLKAVSCYGTQASLRMYVSASQMCDSQHAPPGLAVLGYYFTKM